MNVVKAVQSYLTKMLTDSPGMKVLLLDKDTTPIVSLVFTQSQLLSFEVYLMEKLENSKRESMKHLQCVAFLRPTTEVVQLLADELRDPKYSEYYCYFSNVLKRSQVEKLAEVDEFELVKEIQEFYADYLCVNEDFFSLGCNIHSCPVYGESPSSWDSRGFTRSTEGLISLLLSLKKRPLIRYEKSSPLCKRLAQELNYQIQQETSLFDFRKPDTPPILLLLDRRNDPVTPLLHSWTYQAMVHELLGIDNGRVNLSKTPGIASELAEVVLTSECDPFFKKNMFLNLGDLGATIKAYVDEYQLKHKSSANIESIADMKRFVEEYPEFRRLAGNVSKHVALVGELSRLVEKGKLLEVGELEQSLAAVENHNQDLRLIQQLLANPDVSEISKIKVVLLYALRYEKSSNNSTKQLVDQLASIGVNEQRCGLVDAIIKFAGADQRQEDIFLNMDVLSKTKAVFKGLKGAENIYTRHQPHIGETLENLVKNRLRLDLFPFWGDVNVPKDRPRDVILFFVGGATFEEAKTVSNMASSLNSQLGSTAGQAVGQNSLSSVQQSSAVSPGKGNAADASASLRVVLGCTSIHNSKSFILEMADANERWSSAIKSSSSAPEVSQKHTNM